jgi:ethanolamine ammonia-lyase large subunit
MRSQAQSEGYQGLSRRDVIAIMGAASGAIAAGYSTVAKAASDRSAIAIEEVKPGEDVFGHVSRVKGKFDQSLYQQIIGAANDFKEGDQAIGVGAKDEASRKNARALLANTRIRDIHEHPLHVDDLQRLIWQTTDKNRYAKVQDWTMGRLKQFLLTGSEDQIKDVMNGLNSDVIGCVPKLMSNEELIKRSSASSQERRWAPGGIWAPASNPTPRRIIQKTLSGRSSTPSPMQPVTLSSVPTLSTAR